MRRERHIERQPGPEIAHRVSLRETAGPPEVCPGSPARSWRWRRSVTFKKPDWRPIAAAIATALLFGLAGLNRGVAWASPHQNPHRQTVPTRTPTAAPTKPLSHSPTSTASQPPGPTSTASRPPGPTSTASQLPAPTTARGSPSPSPRVTHTATLSPTPAPTIAATPQTPTARPPDTPSPAMTDTRAAAAPPPAPVPRTTTRTPAGVSGPPPTWTAEATAATADATEEPRATSEPEVDGSDNKCVSSAVTLPLLGAALGWRRRRRGAWSARIAR